MEGLISLGSFVFFITLAFFVGTAVEKAHYKEIEEKEADLLALPVTTYDHVDEPGEVQDVKLIYGSVVISLDYFKKFLAGLRSFFGGRVTAYETLLDRGRREAILRMKQKARAEGFTMIINARFGTANIGQATSQKGTLGCFEVIAYGTAVKKKV
jgi:uncharacterized protein YbjQ (UPF0145 family)